MANSFSPTSGIAWEHNADFTQGAWTVRMEADFDTAGTPAVVEYMAPIPYSIKSLEILNGTIRHEARKPEYGAFGQKTEWKSVGAILMGIVGDPAMGDNGMGPGVYPILNVLTETYDSYIYEIQDELVKCDMGAIPVPPDGSAYQLKLHVEVTAEGGGWPQQIEVSIAGRWTA